MAGKQIAALKERLVVFNKKAPRTKAMEACL
jgi:hypothetical protein